MVTNVRINLIAGDIAPRYDESGMELACEAVNITENATVAGLPCVDFKLSGPDGKFYLLVVSGRIINAISAAVRGANLRNHGVEEP